MTSSICKKIECPYFGDGKAYGCQRYAMSCGCHLRAIHLLDSNEYALFGDVDISALRQENNHFFLEDEKYSDDLAFQAEYPELFGEGRFKVKEIGKV